LRERQALISWLSALYNRIVHAGVDVSTPEPLLDRVIFSNLICLIGSVVTFSMAVINFSKGYHLLFALTVVYLGTLIVCVYLNTLRRYLAARVTLLSVFLGGLFIASLIQGPICEMEHYFIPFGVLAFTVFYAEERIYSFGFLIFAVCSYALFVSQSEPLLNIDPAIGRYSTEDLVANRMGYLALFFTFLIALSNAFNRSLRLVNDQRAKLFEERRMASIGAIACNVAHEINSPLTAFDLQIFQLNEDINKNGVVAAEVQEKLSRLSRISHRMSVIIRGLKFLAGRDDNDPISRSEIGSIIELALDLCRERIEKYGIHMQLSLETQSIQIACRSVALSQVFLNLFNNAIDAVAALPRENRRIEVTSKRLGETIELRIEDSGTITSETIKTNLFKSFFTTKPPGRGTGLGLSLAKETIEMHGGSIRLDDECRNTRFVILLPLPQERE